MGASAASIRAMLDGMCVNTIVLMSPMRRDSQAATGNEKAESTPDQKKKTPAADERHVEALEQPQRQERLDDEAAGEGIEAEQGRQLEDDVPRGPERGRSACQSASCRAVRDARIEQAAEQAQQRIEDEHQP